MSNKLLVESKNDMLFVQALIDYLNLEGIEIDIPICQPDDYECMEGLNASKLEEALTIIKRSLVKERIEKIGIIIDQDSKPAAERLSLVNEAIKNVFETEEEIEDTGKFIKIRDQDDDTSAMELACFLTNVDGEGELETVLRAIKAEESVYADCLESWRTCLKDHHKKISDKDFDKFWVNNYIRFDTCRRRERKQAGRKCSMSAFEYVMTRKTEIWDFDHAVLNEFKNFLHLFASQHRQDA
ncbi:hypothetical protein DENIS_3755 [Desulfonema ishimotonii]|uniref:DUF4435 domain-containing protein n=1 Tax=Desulfonema ishimotonii TaxID=45657 RepID=A0A401G0M4_9BACT|nr:DUF3226 domain-containing protein [Desulfonema ishimotonii]GBC62778.1 hypothetical protein DENIS_3755 [Desulfonema ishimotonii]